MERIYERIKIAERALCTLKEALEHDKPSALIRDAAIQRFEFTVEAVWKLAQLYLRKKAGLELGSPKPVIRACFQEKLLDEAQTSIGIEMIDDRNLTVHTYNEELAVLIFSHLNRYYVLLELLIKKIKENSEIS